MSSLPPAPRGSLAAGQILNRAIIRTTREQFQEGLFWTRVSTQIANRVSDDDEKRLIDILNIYRQCLPQFMKALRGNTSDCGFRDRRRMAQLMKSYCNTALVAGAQLAGRIPLGEHARPTIQAIESLGDGIAGDLSPQLGFIRLPDLPSTCVYQDRCR